MSVLRFTHDQLIEALEARRSWAERLDVEALAQHQKDEKAYLVKFRTACREAVKWDYSTAKDHYFKVMETGYGTQPSCPRSLVADIDRYLNNVRASPQKRFTITEAGSWSRVHHLLTYDEMIKTEMC